MRPGRRTAAWSVGLLASLAVMAGGPAAAGAQAPYLIDPFNHSFGQQAAGTTSGPVTFTLTVRCYANPSPDPFDCMTNNPFTPNVTVSGNFAIRDNGCTAMMPGNSTFGTSCNFNVVFAPLVLGSHTGIVDVGEPGGFGRAGVSGTGIAPPPTPTVPTPAPKPKRCKKKGKGKGAAAAKKCRKKRK
jgi:hypothetical protein